MLTEKEIGLEIIDITRKLVDIKMKKEDDNYARLYNGYLIGMMTALGKSDEFLATDNWLRFTNSVIKEIFEK